MTISNDIYDMHIVYSIILYELWIAMWMDWVSDDNPLLGTLDSPKKMSIRRWTPGKHGEKPLETRVFIVFGGYYKQFWAMAHIFSEHVSSLFLFNIWRCSLGSYSSQNLAFKSLVSSNLKLSHSAHIKHVPNMWKIPLNCAHGVWGCSMDRAPCSSSQTWYPEKNPACTELSFSTILSINIDPAIIWGLEDYLCILVILRNSCYCGWNRSFSSTSMALNPMKLHLYPYVYWLVASTPLKNMKVSWDYYSQ